MLEGDGYIEKKRRGKSRRVKEEGKKRVRVYSDGVFDMFHYGHMRMLEQIRKRFPMAEIVVGVCSDRDTREKKGHTVLEMWERAESLRHCRWVDEVIEDAPWVITKAFITEHRIDYVAHDGDVYPGEGIEDVYQEVKEMGIFVATERTQGISTSQLITRILRSYDDFLKRNLGRGVTGEELNISKFTERRMKFGVRVEENLGKIREKLKEVSVYWDKISAEVGKKFAMLFERPV
ncbi:choline-phosphate cytidylyltransferase [Nematocida homosporus]|uniref:choline-phosphate cytidylyltransferase n=1 Tax=Nematocida homosporus TaxID=1912981 RepID=UPI00222122E2|nr:choline-phosphate cytidylyltransferase [Nematocida homosporus]KAI5185970.1 choline-phosphate cytidylyltransferase [Nematocida homosporus]